MKRHGSVEHAELIAVPHHHGEEPATAVRLDHTRRAHFGNFRLVRFVERQAGHVAGRAVGKRREHTQRDMPLARKDGLFGLDLDVLHDRVVGSGGRRSLSDPSAQDLVIFRIPRQQATAAVGHGPAGLHQQEAFLGRGGEDPTPPRFPDHRLVVFGRLVAEQRELESVLPGGLAVTPTAVTAQLRQQRPHIRGEGNARGCGGITAERTIREQPEQHQQEAEKRRGSRRPDRLIEEYSHDGLSLGDLQVNEASDVVDWFVFHGPDRLQAERQLPAEWGVVGGDNLKSAGVGLAHEGDAPGA